MQKSDNNIRFVFTEMRRLLEAGWQQEVMAKDAAGEPCFVEDEKARSFDLYGAFERVFVKHQHLKRYRMKCKELLSDALNQIRKPENIHDFANTENMVFHLNKFNDTPQRAKMEVLRLVEKAEENA